jgi:hypothetical protein
MACNAMYGDKRQEWSAQDSPADGPMAPAGATWAREPEGREGLSEPWSEDGG